MNLCAWDRSTARPASRTTLLGVRSASTLVTRHLERDVLFTIRPASMQPRVWGFRITFGTTKNTHKQKTYKQSSQVFWPWNRLLLRERLNKQRSPAILCSLFHKSAKENKMPHRFRSELNSWKTTAKTPYYTEFFTIILTEHMHWLCIAKRGLNQTHRN